MGDSCALGNMAVVTGAAGGWLDKLSWLLGLRSVIAFGGMLLSLALSGGAEPQPGTTLRVDFARTNGVIRALHGLNKGPLAAGGLIDVIAAQRELAVPLIRLHDCHWPNPDVVDLHAVFPNFSADPAVATNYDFVRTDEYLAATRQTGAKIVYRLGESIEHTATKRFIHPPADPAHWAQICLGVIRHYNEGWANGFRHDIRYWEIWNEPENRPAMWSGTDEDYFRLYCVAARAIKDRYPGLKVGGPAVGASGHFSEGVFRPTAFVTNFLARCRREAVPLDFFSWHCYTADPTEPGRRARAIRQLLDAHGFLSTEIHLNEWNYLPGDSWAPLARTAEPAARQRYHEEMAGAPGAAFITAVLLDLQDAPVDAANLFHGELGGFGLFNEHGVAQPNFHALRAFRELLRTPQRVEVQGGDRNRVFAVAGLNPTGTEAGILLATLAATNSETRLAAVHLPWNGMTRVETHRVDQAHSFSLADLSTNAPGAVEVALPGNGPAVIFLRLHPAAR